MDDLDVPLQEPPRAAEQRPADPGQGSEAVLAPAAPSASDPAPPVAARPGALATSCAPGGTCGYPSEDEDPFGFGGGMDNLDAPLQPSTGSGSAGPRPGEPRLEEAVLAPAAPIAGPAPERVAARVRGGPQSPRAHGSPRGAAPAQTASPVARTVQAPAAPSSASRGPTPSWHHLPDRIETVKAEGGPTKVETDTAAPPARAADRRAALSAHLARRPAPTPTRREAALRRSMRDLQRQCADLGRTMAEVRARQGPLVQRLQAAQAALTTLSTSSAASGSAAVQALQATLSQALQVHRTMQPPP